MVKLKVTNIGKNIPLFLKKIEKIKTSICKNN